MIHAPTQALREGSAEVLREGLARMLAAYANEERVDVRDVMWSLAPYHDCARRLGLDPAAFFDRAAEATSATMRDLVREFGRRTDTSPETFGGYAVVETRDGPAYVWR